MPRAASSSKPADIRVTRRVYHPRCEFRTRFTSEISMNVKGTQPSGFFAMDDRKRWVTYHRSVSKKLEGVTSNLLAFAGNNKKTTRGQNPKTGNFFNPFKFTAYQSAIKGSDKPDFDPYYQGWLYDKLLKWQKSMAKDIVRQVHARNPDIQINADHGYPCVLLAIPKPPNEKNEKIWSRLVGMYLLAISNRLARERGINIEMVRRSSFGALRPSITDCGKSTRISLGLVPGVYANNILIDAILFTHSLLTQPDKYFNMPLILKRLENTLETYNQGLSSKKSVSLKETLWDTLWARGDSNGPSFASQFFRKEIVPEYLIDQMLLMHPEKTLEMIFRNERWCRETFAHPLARIFGAFHLNKKGQLAIDEKKLNLQTFDWYHERPVYDPAFQILLLDFALQTGMSTKNLASLRGPGLLLHHLHNYFENYLMSFFFNLPIALAAKDGFGSDSDCEASIDISDDQETLTVFSKKFITATGMRAIQMAYAIARMYLIEKHHMDTLEISFNAQNMYYETDEALTEKHSIPILVTEKRTVRGKQQCIGFFDQNHCNASQSEAPKYEFGRNDKVFVLDITSSTTKEIGKQLLSSWETRPGLEVILTVSSGLKNEQGMSDYNPYGTVRIFARSRAVCDWLYLQLVQCESAADYKHPAASHWMRRTAKAAGMTPTNAKILDVYDEYRDEYIARLLMHEKDRQIDSLVTPPAPGL
ncbi:hypothetical protein Lmor_2279 [Legionella moravica]|uniref:Uncharacterized protein n=2 Tax=Legionella moravica TaxID=39962 RepID=A0A378JVH8_9GAMM|nr:hypothetical protein Lmor_2279 [Legionella moravica]STX62436.1 Uncharacterised protein [Legionella moravica]